VSDLRTFGTRFWVFLAGESISEIGSWASLVAIWGYAAFAFDADPGQIGLIGLAWLLPPVVLGPFAGTAIDRVGPRRVLVVSKAIGAVASIALVFAESYSLLIVFSFGHGVATAFSRPALEAMPPRIVDDARLAATNALLHMATNLAIVLGPVAAAGSIALIGFDGAFIFDAVTYLVGIGAVFAVRVHPPLVQEEHTGAWSETVRGLRIVATSRPLRATVVLMFGVYFLYGTALMLEPIYVRDVLERPVSTFALLQTAFGVCLVATGVLVARLGDRVAGLRVVSLAVAGSALGAMWYLGTTSVVMAFAGVMVWGAITAFLAGPSRTLLQRNAPPGAQGRVLAVDQTAEGIGHLVAMPVAAALAAALGVQGAALVIGLGVVALGTGGLIRTSRIEVAGPVATLAPAEVLAEA
jgi:predicted MFS family arabinose efflux permease